MSDVEVVAAGGPKKPKTKASHPPTQQMVDAAISSLKERTGSSLLAIKKHIATSYKVDAEKLAPYIKKYIKSAVVSGKLVQTKGKGASGSFRLSASAQKEGTAAVQKAAPKKAVAAKKPVAKKPAVTTNKKPGEKVKSKVAAKKTTKTVVVWAKSKKEAIAAAAKIANVAEPKRATAPKKKPGAPAKKSKPAKK